MKYRLFLSIFLITTALSLLSACSSSGKTTGNHRNVILISVDTLRADEMGIYGSRDGLTPTLDHFAVDGTIFTKCQAASPWTLPSHGSMLTGQYPSTHRAVFADRGLSPNAFSLPEYLQGKGFATGAFVSYVWLGRDFGFSRGMDVHEIYESQPSDKLIESALKWIEEKPSPFFCFIHLFDPHEPYTPPADLRLRLAPGCTVGSGINVSHKIGLADDAKGKKCLRQLYRGEVALSDHLLKGLFTHLEKVGLNENTLVVFTSDHGESFWEKGVFGHGNSLYQELLHVPLVIRGPDFPSHLRIEAPVSHVDIAPTVLSWLGIERLKELEGIDLLDGKEMQRRKTVFSQIFLRPFAGIAAYDGRYKWIDISNAKIGSGHLRSALYDLQSDPGETKDIADQQGEKRKELAAAVDDIGSLKRKQAFALRYQGGLGDVDFEVTCPMGVAGCEAIDYHTNLLVFMPHHYKRTQTYQGQNTCSGSFGFDLTPDTVYVLPLKEGDHCTARFRSKKLAPAVLRRNIRDVSGKKLGVETVLPESGSIEDVKGKKGIYLGVAQVPVVDPPLVGELGEEPVKPDEAVREKLKALGYL